MANLKRVRVDFGSAGVVGPSVSTFYFDATASGFSASLQTFFQAIKALMPDDLLITVPNTGDLVQDSNGVLAGVWTDSGGSTTVGTSATAFALGTGGRVQWLTGGFRGGRRVIGTTFLVPLASAAFDTGGNVSAASVATIQAAASALVTAQAGHMLIWGKPHTKAAADGVTNVVIAGLARQKPTSLRSRRV